MLLPTEGALPAGAALLDSERLVHGVTASASETSRLQYSLK